MMEARENKMGVMPEGKLLASMAIPMMFSMLLQALYNVVDSYFVSRVSQDAFNALSLAFPLQALIIALGGGTGLGVNALISRALGEKDQETADRVANTGIVLFALCAALFSLVGFTCSGPFFRAQTDVPGIVEAGTTYCTICLGFSAGIFFQFCFERFLQATGRSTLSMATQVTGALLNIALDPILIFGYFGFPAMGVRGAAIATVFGQIVSACIGLVLNLRKNHDIHLKLSEMRFHGDIAKEVYRIGLPSIVMQSISSILVFCLNQILLTFSTVATAVYGAYFKLQSFIFMPVFGLNNGMIPIISYNFGARRADRVKKTIRLAILTAMSIMAIGLLAFELFPSQLLRVFNAEGEMLAQGVPALRIIATHFVLAGFCIIAGSVCQAIGNPTHSLVISVCRQMVVLLPAAYLLSLTRRLELVWLAFPIAEVVSLTLSAYYLRRTLKSMDAKLAAEA
ncbi:MAG: MATE family efflux transporter [Oscillospiraceae bacterium]|nr:MATE family efflux transporter [Oscillospiraceae bacterium]